MKSHTSAQCSFLLTWKHLSPSESAGDYCSSAALQSTRCQHSRVEYPNVQKRRDPLPPACWPPSMGRQWACRVPQDGKDGVWAAPHLQELFHPEGEAFTPFHIVQHFLMAILNRDHPPDPSTDRHSWSSILTGVILLLILDLMLLSACMLVRKQGGYFLCRRPWWQLSVSVYLHFVNTSEFWICIIQGWDFNANTAKRICCRS